MRQKADVLYSEEQIASRVAELGAEITRAFEGRQLCVLGLMSGSVVFMADLVRRISLDLTTDHFSYLFQAQVHACSLSAELSAKWYLRRLFFAQTI